MYLSLIILPLLGSIASGLLGRKLGVTGSQLITTSLVIITTILAIIAYLEVGLNSIPVSIHLFRWIDSESLIVYWGFHFDSLTASMLLPVLVVSSLVHVFSIGYMGQDPQKWIFVVIYVCLFLEPGIGVYNGLFHTPVITHNFGIFAHNIGAIILLLPAPPFNAAERA